MKLTLRTISSAILAIALGSLTAPAGAQDFDQILKPAVQPGFESVISGFGGGDVRKTEAQREEVKTLARSKLGVTIGGQTNTDLDAIQRLLDGRYVGATDVRLQQSLGVVLGDALARDHRTLSWVVIDDRQGHSRALRYRESKHLFFPVSMISKRIALQEAVDVRALYDQVVAAAAKLDEEFEANRRRSQGRR